MRTIKDALDTILAILSSETEEERVEHLNEIKLALHKTSPFKDEPVDCVLWVPCQSVHANDYNPNTVAPPEMELLRHSIGHDGYTQPVVTWASENGREVVDGFHRRRVCVECEDVNKRVHGYLPVVSIKEECSTRNDRIASTIRHNRARGKHRVQSMSDIVIELKKRNWSDEKIGRELGMDPDEVLRLCQVTGLADVFKNHEFSKSWEIGDESAFEDVDDDQIGPIGKQEPGRIYHTFEKWECKDHNFYGTTAPDGMTSDDAERAYSKLLSNDEEFQAALYAVITTWKYSCEHYLTNEKMNRIAWLGQAALAQKMRIPACFRGGFNLLTKPQQDRADQLALEALNAWLKANNRPEVDMSSARSKVDAELY